MGQPIDHVFLRQESMYLATKTRCMHGVLLILKRVSLLALNRDFVLLDIPLNEKVTTKTTWMYATEYPEGIWYSRDSNTLRIHNDVSMLECIRRISPEFLTNP